MKRIIIILTIAMMLVACSENSKGSPFAGREPVDLSGYEAMQDYEGESRFTDTTVREILDLMDKGESFMFLAAFDDCPECDRVISYLNNALIDADAYAGYLNTRADPSWTANRDIDDYELFVERFVEYLDPNENDEPYLYVPDLYVIKDGKVVAHNMSVIGGEDYLDEKMTEEHLIKLQEELTKLLAEL